MDAIQRAVENFSNTYNAEPVVVARAPGRVNLIGEHTDYNYGFVLPMALPFNTVIAARPIEGDVVTVTSEGFSSEQFSLSDDPAGTTQWARYVHAVATILADEGHVAAPQAWEGVITTDIPPGASLSSSAALEVAAGLIYTSLADVKLSAAQLARVGQRVENEVMGLPSGILDQLASAGSQADKATLIDCRSLELRTIDFPDGATIVVLDTGTRRELVESEYADRQATCAEAARLLGLEALRDATIDDVERLGSLDGATQRHVDRARHVVNEDTRTLAAVEAMEAGDLKRLGELMVESHQSLRDLYEVSGPALDAIVDAALESANCIGARMTGGGFAGGAIALVADDGQDSVEVFCQELLNRYETPPEQPATAPTKLYSCLPSAGADYVSPVG